VHVFDTTLRDGEQTPGVHFNVGQKVAIAQALEDLGVDTIEAGFPISSPGDAEAVREVATAVESAEVAALARCAPGDIDAAFDAIRGARRPVVHIVLGASDIHLEAKLGISRAEALRRVERCVAHAKSMTREVEFSPEDATRADRAFLRQMVRVAVDAGATRVNVPDTVGFALPWEYAAMIADIVRTVPQTVRVAAHCHDDLGMAVANSVAAVAAGATEVQVTVNGIGERAGNAALEEFVTAVSMKAVGVTGIKSRELPAVSAAVAGAARMPVPPNKAVVGANAFAHSSGIHQDGIIKDPRTYGFLQPEHVGVQGHRMVLTARSGRRALAEVARSMGFEISGESLDAAYREFLKVADAAAGGVDDAALREIFKSEVNEPRVVA
jgi:2-isopropylmalate synthase